MYPNLIPVLDTSYLVERYVNVNKPMLRIICKVRKKVILNKQNKVTNSIQDFVNSECEAKMYHPKSLVNYHRQNLSQCEH